MAVCGVVPVAATLPVFPSIVPMPALQRDHFTAVIPFIVQCRYFPLEHAPALQEDYYTLLL